MLKFHVRKGEWIYLVSLGVLLLLHFLLVKPLLPHSIWHEFHAASLLDWAGGASDGLAVLHGPAYGRLMGALRAATPNAVSVFDLNYAVSAAAAGIFYAALRVWTGSAPAAWAGAALLLFLPVRMRLSVTESPFVWVEALWASAALCAGLLFRGDSRFRPYWAAGTALSLALLVNLRAEMLLLVPAALAFYGAALRPKPRPGGLRSPALWAAAALSLAWAFRAASLLSLHDPRTGSVLPGSAMRLLGEKGLAGLNIFFDPAWTPLFIPVLSAAGAVLLAVRRRALLAAVAAHIGLATLVYSGHLSCLAVRARTAPATQFLFAGLAAYGFGLAVKRLGPRGRAAACFALLCAAAWGAAARRSLLTEEFAKQIEFSFIEEAPLSLPPGAGVAFLGRGDPPDPGWERDYQGALLERAARRAGRPVVPMTIPMARRLAGQAGPQELFFYRGLPCSTAPGLTEHPACIALAQEAGLKPIRELRVTARSHSPEKLPAGGAVLGLYRFGKVPSSREAAAVPANAWLRLAEKARDAGSKSLLRAALAAASEEAADPESLASTARLLQESGDHGAAHRLFDRLVSEHPESAVYRRDRGVLRALMGDAKSAEDDLRRAMELDPSDPSARRSLDSLRDPPEQY